MEDCISKTWLQWGLLNLALVALYGTLMRYKIAFDFPYLQQKYLAYAHFLPLVGGAVICNVPVRHL
ncbi:hypothetical protein [Niabella sp.]|uniref:hypothetical protein n=1 Tax=Niabella sp. TaxID=1962976 RepID=UPI0026169E53|nr:hypothetical protein [Niabella sp.]